MEFQGKSSLPVEDSALHLLRIGDLNGAWRTAEEELRTTDARPRAYWICHFVRAEVLRIRGQAKEALEYLNLLPRPRYRDVEFRAMLGMHRGYCFEALGQHQTAIDLLREASTLASSRGLSELQGEITSRQAMIAYRQRNYHSSEELYRRVGDSCGERFGWYLHCIARGGVGKSLMARREFEKALPWLEEAIEVAEAAGSKLFVAGLLAEAAICHLGLGYPDKALEIHLEVDKVLWGLGARHGYQVNLADMGNVYLHKGDYLTSISYYHRALLIAREINDSVSVEKWSFNIQVAYGKLRKSITQQAERPDATE